MAESTNGTSNAFSWDFFNKRVQDLPVGKFINGAYVLIAAGPPALVDLSMSAAAAIDTTTITDEATLKTQISGADQGQLNADVYPLGITQSWNVGQNRQFMQIFEIGSERSVFISGRSTGSLSLGRVLYSGASLLKMLYASGTLKKTDDTKKGAANTLGSYEGHNIKKPAGYGDFYFNLYSDMFVKPFGLFMAMKDVDENLYAAAYFEQAYVPNYNFGADAQGTIIQESSSVLFERIIPIPVDFIDTSSESS